MADEDAPPAVAEFKPLRPLLIRARPIGVKLDIKALLTNPTRRVEWMVDGLISEKAISIVSGVAYLGKSYVGMELAIAAASGRPLFGTLPVRKKYRVGYFDLEMMREDTERRFQRLLKMEPEGIDLSNLHIFAESTIRIDENDSDSFDKLKKLIKEYEFDLIVIDSLRRMHLGDDKDSRQSNKIFAALKEIRDTEHCGSMIIAHWRKQQAEFNMNDPAERLAGAADWRNFVDVHIAIVKHPSKDHLTIFPDKGRQSDGAPDRFVVKFEHADRTDEDGPFHLVNTETKAQSSSEDRLKCVLDGGVELTVKDLANKAEVPVKTAHRIVKRWRETGEAKVSGSKPMMISLVFSPPASENG